MAIKMYFTNTRAPGLEPHQQIQVGVIPGTFSGREGGVGVNISTEDAVSIP